MPAIQVDLLSKRFKLHHERANTLKQRLVSKRRKGYHEFWALRDISFEVDQGKTFGLIGANGSGKSTLLRIMAGILKPTSGSISMTGRIAALLELGAGFHSDLTGRENVFLNGSILGFSKKEIESRFDAIVDFAELEAFIDNKVRHYSSGMYVRLGFAVAIHMDPAILLVDEVLAVGDESFQDKCLGRIRQFQTEGRTIVFVTHSVDQIRDLCDEALLLSNGEMALIGKPAEVVRKYRELLASEHPPSIEELNATGTVEIKSIRLLDPTGSDADVFASGERMLVEVEVDCKEALLDPVFNVNIHDNSGQHIFGTNTDWRWLSLDLYPGSAKITVDFSMVPMREGRFTLSFGIHSRDGTTFYAWSDRKTSFEIHSASDEPGRLFLPCRFDAEGPAVTLRQ